MQGAVNAFFYRIFGRSYPEIVCQFVFLSHVVDLQDSRGSCSSHQKVHYFYLLFIIAVRNAILAGQGKIGVRLWIRIKWLQVLIILSTPFCSDPFAVLLIIICQINLSFLQLIEDMMGIELLNAILLEFNIIGQQLDLFGFIPNLQILVTLTDRPLAFAS